MKTTMVVGAPGLSLDHGESHTAGAGPHQGPDLGLGLEGALGRGGMQATQDAALRLLWRRLNC